MTEYKCKYCGFIHTETEYKGYWASKLLDHLFPLHKNQVPFMWIISDIIEQFEVREN